MSAYFWGESVRHSIYLLNRLPTRVLSAKTPQQVWSGKKPNLKYVRVFGCTVYMKIPDIHTKKLNNRSRVVINLGKEAGTKAYRLFDSATGSVMVSRDVTFDKKKPWDWEGQSNEDSMTGNIIDVADMSPVLEESVEEEQESITTPVQTRETEFHSTHDESGEPRRL